MESAVAIYDIIEKKNPEPMFHGLFKNRELDALGIKFTGAIILEQLLKFAVTGKMHTENINGVQALWLHYETIAENNNLTVRQVKAAVSQISGKQKTGERLFPYPIKMYILNKHGKNSAYFIFQKDSMLRLLGDDYRMHNADRLEAVLTDIKMIEQQTEKAERQQRKVSGPAEEIIRTILNAKTNPFKNLLPEKQKGKLAGKWSKGLINVSDILWSLHEGDFLYGYPLSNDFYNERKFSRGDYIDTIKAVKGDWDKVDILIRSAIRNGRKAGTLDTDLNKWLYNANPGNESSLFCFSLVAVPEEVKQARIEYKEDEQIGSIKTYLSDRAVRAANQLLDDHSDWPGGMDFWKRISSIQSWAIDHKRDFERLDSNTGYFFDRCGEDFIPKYVDFISSWKDLKQHQIGIGKKQGAYATFDAFLRWGMKNHDIGIDLTMDDEELKHHIEQKNWEDTNND